MFDQNRKGKRKSIKQYDSHFWDKLVRVLFISGVVIILITIASKWLGFLD